MSHLRELYETNEQIAEICERCTGMLSLIEDNGENNEVTDYLKAEIERIEGQEWNNLAIALLQYRLLKKVYEPAITRYYDNLGLGLDYNSYIDLQVRLGRLEPEPA